MIRRLTDRCRASAVAGMLLVGVTSVVSAPAIADNIALGEAAKYAVPSMGAWIGVETLSGVIQFTIAGLLLWLAHNRSGVAAS